MKIYFEIEECKNAELMEKMKQIKDYDGFRELALEYGWSEAVDAFAAVNFFFDYFYCKEMLLECFYGGEWVGDYDSILYNAIENALEDEELEEKRPIDYRRDTILK